jgi:hypothetical protein
MFAVISTLSVTPLGSHSLRRIKGLVHWISVTPGIRGLKLLLAAILWDE